jgi:hypothetical protein
LPGASAPPAGSLAPPCVYSLRSLRSLRLSKSEPDGNCRSAQRNNNNPSNRNNNIWFRVVLAPAQPGRRRAHRLIRRPSRPARRTKRRQTEIASRRVQVGKRSLPKAPGGLWDCQAPSRSRGHRCWSAAGEPSDLIRANRSDFRECQQAAFKVQMQLCQS